MPSPACLLLVAWVLTAPADLPPAAASQPSSDAFPSVEEFPLDVPLDSDRPTFSLSPVTLQAGRMQGETGVTWSRQDETEAWSVGELLIRFGLTDAWEGRLMFRSYRLDDRSGGDGWEGLSLGIKRRLSSAQGARPAAAVIVDATVATGSGAFGDQGLEPSAALALSWSVGPDWRVATTMRAAWLDGSADGLDDHFLEASSGLAVERRLSERHRVFAEVFTLVRESEHGGDRPYVQAGLIYRFYDFQLDLRAGTRLESDEDFVGGGLMVKW